MPQISELLTLIKADATQFNQTIDQASARVGKFSGAMSSFFKGAGVALAVRQLDKMVTSLDDIGDSANKIGISTKAFQQLSYAAKLSGTSIDSVTVSMAKFDKNLFNPGKEFTTSLSRLSLNPEVLKNLTSDQKYIAVAEALAKIGNKSEQNALAMEVWGRSGVQNLGMVREGIRKTIAEYDKMGSAASDQAITMADNYDKTRQKLIETFKGLGNNLVVTLGPSLTLVADILSKSAQGWSFIIQRMSKEAVYLGNVIKTNWQLLNGTNTSNIGSSTIKFSDVIKSNIPNMRENAAIELTEELKSVIPALDDFRGKIRDLTNSISSTLDNNLNMSSTKRIKDILGYRLSGEDELERLKQAEEAAHQKVQNKDYTMSDVTAWTKARDDLEQARRQIKTTVKNTNFDRLYQSAFDTIEKGGSQEEVQRLFKNLSEQTKAMSQTMGSNQTNRPNMKALEELRRFGEQAGYDTKMQEIKVTIHTTEGFNATIANSPQIHTAVINGVKTFTDNQANLMR